MTSESRPRAVYYNYPTKLLSVALPQEPYQVKKMSYYRGNVQSDHILRKKTNLLCSSPCLISSFLLFRKCFAPKQTPLFAILSNPLLLNPWLLRYKDHANSSLATALGVDLRIKENASVEKSCSCVDFIFLTLSSFTCPAQTTSSIQDFLVVGGDETCIMKSNSTPTSTPCQKIGDITECHICVFFYVLDLRKK